MTDAIITTIRALPFALLAWCVLMVSAIVREEMSEQ